MSKEQNVLYFKNAQERAQKVRDLEIEPPLIFSQEVDRPKDTVPRSLLFSAALGAVLTLTITLVLAWI